MYQSAQDRLEAAKNIEASMYKLETGEAIADAIAEYEKHMEKAIHHLADLITSHGHKFCGSKTIDGHYFLAISKNSRDNIVEIAANLESVNAWLRR